MISASEVLALAPAAIENGEFVAYFQPQYNHSNGMIVGAEALVRWISPKYGMISPADFIPVLEENNLIPKLDTCVFEQACKFLAHSKECNLPLLRISVNISRNDICCEGFVEGLDAIRKKYGVDTKHIHVEITETAAAVGEKEIIDTVKKFHSLGYIVEMDDFGSGYSSLNVLKDIEFDVLKLDLKFISGSIGNARGGTILSSIVRMAKWLKLPVIAEGVETVEQADFLKSVGCDYVQGYLYSRPIPQADYEALLNKSGVGAVVPQVDFYATIKSGKFWNPDSLETLIFSNFVGAAAIFDVHDNKVEVLRVNQKYLREFGMNLTEKETIALDPLSTMNEENQKIFLDMLNRAAETRDEEECETWRCIHSGCCGTENFCIRSSARLIGESAASRLFYIMVRNITKEKLVLESMLTTERRFKAASEQANIYFWEYDILTKEMRPCFRCQRDLGAPPLVRNYPEPFFENGIFPPDYADMYREMMRKVDSGIGSIEAVIPLTANRIPFHVRYTTEFDEVGRPIKAYGSATLVVDK